MINGAKNSTTFCPVHGSNALVTLFWLI